MGNQIKIIKAEAWVDTQPIQPTPGGTLHVVVEFNGENRQALLVKRVPQGINPEILLLNLEYTANHILVNNPQTVEYTEELPGSSNYYQSIEIYFEDNVVAEINNIPIIK